MSRIGILNTGMLTAAFALWAFAAQGAGLVENKALEALPASVVLPAPITSWEQHGTLTCELWVQPRSGSADCPILSLGSARFSLKGGRPCLTAGSAVLRARCKGFQGSEWHHVALSVDKDTTTLYVDGQPAARARSTPFLKAMRSHWKGLVLSPRFSGRRDEIRLWNDALGAAEDDFWRHGPLAVGHPKYGRLVGNWKLDGDFRDCKWAEFAQQTGGRRMPPWSAVPPRKARFSPVEDNEVFRYRITAAYVRESHIKYRWLSREHLVNNSDLIYIGGIEPGKDGRLVFADPDNDIVDLQQPGVRFLPQDGGVTSVYAFDAPARGLHAGKGLLPAPCARSFTIEARLAFDGEARGVLFENETVSLEFFGQGGDRRVCLHAPDSSHEASLPSEATHGYFWLAFIRNGNTASFYLNGSPLATTGKAAQKRERPGETVLGRNFSGKIDEMRVWHAARGAKQLGQDIRPLWADRTLVARWGASEVPGRDTASWAEYIRLLRRWTRGVEGLSIRMDVSGGDWRGLLADAAQRENFAADVARVLARYGLDGVDLDFEWPLNNQSAVWEQYGLLAEAIRKKNPNALFSVSLHTVSYAFPPGAMKHVDYFTFQNYGPTAAVNGYDSMVEACGRFRKQGFPDAKILLSAPFQGTPGHEGLPKGKKAVDYIMLYRDFAHSAEVADPACDLIPIQYPNANLTLHYNGVDTVRRKARYIADQKLGGFMYWDSGGDIADKQGKSDYFHARSLLKAANRYNGSTAYPAQPPVLAFGSAGLTLAAEGTAKALPVRSENAALAWKIVEKPDWVKINAAEGTGSARLAVSADPLQDPRERRGVLRLVAPATEQQCVCLIVQHGRQLAPNSQDKAPVSSCEN